MKKSMTANERIKELEEMQRSNLAIVLKTQDRNEKLEAAVKVAREEFMRIRKLATAKGATYARIALTKIDEILKDKA